VGAVIGLWGFGAPANWIVLVDGLTVVWALAMRAAKASKKIMQDKTQADLPSRAEVVNMEFKWRLPVSWALAQRSLKI